MLASTIHLLPDKTFFPLLAIFVIVLIVLNRCVFRPILRIFDRRFEATGGEEERAHQLEKASDGYEAEIRRELDALQIRGNLIREKIRRDAEEGAHRLVDAAHAERADIIARGMDERREAQRQAERIIDADAQRLKDLIVERMLEARGTDG